KRIDQGDARFLQIVELAGEALLLGGLQPLLEDLLLDARLEWAREDAAVVDLLEGADEITLVGEGGDAVFEAGLGEERHDAEEDEDRDEPGEPGDDVVDAVLAAARHPNRRGARRRLPVAGRRVVLTPARRRLVLLRRLAERLEVDLARARAGPLGAADRA